MRNAEYPDALHNPGVLEARRGRLDKAIRVPQMTLRLGPGHGEARRSLAAAEAMLSRGWNSYGSD